MAATGIPAGRSDRPGQRSLGSGRAGRPGEDLRQFGLGWLQDLRQQYSSIYAELLPPLFDAFAERYGNQLDPDQLAIITAFRQHVGRFSAEQRGPVTVLHGDYRTDNML